MFYKTKHKILHAEHIKTLAEMIRLRGELTKTKAERDTLAATVADLTVRLDEVAFQASVQATSVQAEPPVAKKTRRKAASTTVDL